MSDPMDVDVHPKETAERHTTELSLRTVHPAAPEQSHLAATPVQPLRSSKPCALSQLLVAPDLDHTKLFRHPRFGLHGCQEIMTMVVMSQLKVDQLREQDEHRVQSLFIKLFNAAIWMTPNFSGEQDDLWLKGLTDICPLFKLIDPDAIRAVITTLVECRRSASLKPAMAKARSRLGKPIEEFRQKLNLHKSRLRRDRPEPVSFGALTPHRFWKTVPFTSGGNTEMRRVNYWYSLTADEWVYVTNFLKIDKARVTRAHIRGLPEAVSIHLRRLCFAAHFAAKGLQDIEVIHKWRMARLFIEGNGEVIDIPDGWGTYEWRNWVHAHVAVFMSDPIGPSNPFAG